MNMLTMLGTYALASSALVILARVYRANRDWAAIPILILMVGINIAHVILTVWLFTEFFVG